MIVEQKHRVILNFKQEFQNLSQTTQRNFRNNIGLLLNNYPSHNNDEAEEIAAQLDEVFFHIYQNLKNKPQCFKDFAINLQRVGEKCTNEFISVFSHQMRHNLSEMLQNDRKSYDNFTVSCRQVYGVFKEERKNRINNLKEFYLVKKAADLAASGNYPNFISFIKLFPELMIKKIPFSFKMWGSTRDNQYVVFDKNNISAFEIFMLHMKTNKYYSLNYVDYFRKIFAIYEKNSIKNEVWEELFNQSEALRGRLSNLILLSKNPLLIPFKNLPPLFNSDDGIIIYKHSIYYINTLTEEFTLIPANLSRLLFDSFKGLPENRAVVATESTCDLIYTHTGIRLTNDPMQVLDLSITLQNLLTSAPTHGKYENFLPFYNDLQIIHDMILQKYTTLTYGNESVNKEEKNNRELNPNRKGYHNDSKLAPYPVENSQYHDSLPGQSKCCVIS